MRLMLATLLTTTVATQALAQSDVVRAGGAEFFGVKTYWAEKREGCQPMISLKIKNPSSGDLGPIALHLDVVDKDKNAVFARGLASVPSIDLPPGRTKDIAIGGDHDITAHECLGDMHETAFSGIHFAVRLIATAGPGAASVEIVRDEAMKEELVREQN
jgi:hypothetical protein